MLNNYETVFIITPVLSEAQMKEAVSKFKTYLTEHGAEVVHSENWGLRKLAYPIQKKTTGFYNLIEFKAEGTLNVDNLQEGMFILEVEDEGEVDLYKYLKKFGDSYIKISISDKVEKEAKEEE